MNEWTPLQTITSGSPVMKNVFYDSKITPTASPYDKKRHIKIYVDL